jgi:glutamate/tyrosine decarboxylase-like PLP-dependent enzyme
MRKYERHLNNLRRNFFWAPDGNNTDKLVKLFQVALKSAINHQGEGPIYPRSTKSDRISTIAKKSKVPNHITKSQELLLRFLSTHLEGSVKASNPYMVKNIIPLPAFIYVATNAVVSLYMANGVTGEDAAEALNAEIACASAIAKLAGFDVNRAAGVFTFGGTGTNLYAHKIGLAKLSPQLGLKGYRSSKIVTVGSRSSHYSHQTVSDWLGIGQRNYIQVASNIDQTTNLQELEKACRSAIKAGKKIACIEAVGGTTSNMAIDDVKKIYTIRKKLIAEFKLSYTPHIHVDSVLGWAYLNFLKYDFKNNPLGFSAPVLQNIKRVVKNLKTIIYADSFGVDFHKSGYTPYVSSMIIVKNQNDFGLLLRDRNIMTPLFHDDAAYNPGMFTLETSRSTANMVATWFTLQALGQEGYQTLLGHSQEMAEYIRGKIHRNEGYGLHIVNQNHFGSDIFVRCYPIGVSPAAIFREELSSDYLLEKYDMYMNQFAKWFFREKSPGNRGLALSKTSAAFYTHTGKPVIALRIYLLNPFITKQIGDEIVKRLVSAKKEFDEIYQSKIQLPHDKNNTSKADHI